MVPQKRLRRNGGEHAVLTGATTRTRMAREDEPTHGEALSGMGIGGGGGGWHKASVSDCVPLAALIGLSPLLILTLCVPERALVVSREPPDDLSCGGGGGGGGGQPPPPPPPR